MNRKRWTAMLGILLLTACTEGYDPPEEANPFDTIAPAPTDTTPVGGARSGGDDGAGI